MAARSRALRRRVACQSALPGVSHERRNTMSELESLMSPVQVEQKTYKMPPQDGFTVAHFLTVADIERSLRFYETVFGGRILSKGDSSGAPGYIQIANTWLLVNVGGGPTPDKPSVTLSVPRQSRFSQQLYEYSRCRYSSVL